MTLTFSIPPSPDSALRRLDPRWKLAALLMAALAAAGSRTLPAVLVALVGALLLALLARLPLRWFVSRLGAMALVLGLFVAPLPLLLPGDGPTWGILHLSRHGASVAVLLAVKAITLVTLALILLATAPVDATLKAAHALRMPGLIVQIALLSYRYLFLLADELGRLRNALRVRGYRNRPTRHCYRTVGHVAGTLLVRGYERAERVGQAMRCRGFDGQFRSLATFHTTVADVAAFVLIVAVSLGVWYLDWKHLG